VQLDKSHAAHGTNDAWPAGEPGSAVGGQGPPGTVHVVATPRGAEVWMLAGLGPDARIEQQLACTEDVELLLAGPTTFRKRLHISAADFAPDDTAGTPGGAPVGPGKSPRRVAHVSGK
jgi:CubicO group peptidase (beta-lactamase class C family)